jgi:hypothetical protein
MSDLDLVSYACVPAASSCGRRPSVTLAHRQASAVTGIAARLVHVVGRRTRHTQAEPAPTEDTFGWRAAVSSMAAAHPVNDPEPPLVLRKVPTTASTPGWSTTAAARVPWAKLEELG